MENLIKLKNIVSLLIFISVSINISAQLENSNWYFGNQAAINFNDGTTDPSALTDGVMSTEGGSASISDTDGNLLFYTNGINVWGADHKTIKNGTGLCGSTTVSQAVLIVPNPNEDNEYYIFTNQAQEPNSHGLNYSIVKLTEKDDDDDDDDKDYEYCNKKKTKVRICHNGKNTICVSMSALQAHLDHGDSIGSCDDDDDDKEFEYSVTSKNIPLLPYASEKLTAVYNQANNSYWVMSFAPDSDATHNDTFYSFKVDNNGINLAKKSTFTFLPINEDNTGGQMKITTDLKNLGMVHNTQEIGRDGGLEGVESIFTFDFDQASGSVSSIMLHSILKDQNSNSIELLSSSNNGFINVHNMLSGQNKSTNIIASAYGFEFSPDGDKFYVSTKEQIDYDLLNVSQNINIYQVLYRKHENYDPSYYPLKQLSSNLDTQVFSLQMGVDDKIYGVNNSGNLDRIINPNGLDYTAGYEYSAISLNGKTGSKGLPQLIQVNQDNSSNRSAESKQSVVQGNPFKNELVIDLSQLRNVEFYDERGVLIKLVVYSDLSDRDVYNIDTSDLAVGIYFLVIKDENSQVYNEKVFKVD